MAEEDKIKYSDIIEPDDSIEKLVKQLGELNASYETMVNAIKSGAEKIVSAMKTASGATKDGRAAIDEATLAASRLERAQRELRLAMTDTGKQIAWLKAQTSDQNKASVEQQRYIAQAISSYDRLKADLKETVALYKSLTEAERADSEMGQRLLADIINLKNQVKALDDQMKPHINTLTEVQKAEQKLAYLQSEEGQKLLDLKAKIAEVTAARRKHKVVIDAITQAKQKLAYAGSDENRQLQQYNIAIKRANEITKLQAIINNEAEGSYNRLSAQYRLNKIALNAMSTAEREAVDIGKKLEAETLAIYVRMRDMQEATGNYRLSVGNYKRIWDGLGFSIAQVVREIPNAAVSMNTFFLAISNNIPMVMDEIKKIRIQNKQAILENRETVSVTKEVVKSLVSWNTALIILLSVLTMWGQDILDWIGSLFKAKDAVISLGEATRNVAKELEKTNDSYGKNIVTLKKLAVEYKNLKTVAEKTKWIDDNKSKFDGLGASVTNVNQADNLFIENTQAFVDALKDRAKAAAAMKLASEQYEKALVARNKAEVEARLDPTTSDKLKNALIKSVLRDGGDLPVSATNIEAADRLSAEGFKQRRIKGFEDEAKAAEDLANAYFKLSERAEESADKRLKAAGIDTAHKTKKKPQGHTPRDAEDTLESLSLAATKAYQKSVTELEREEIAKRRKQYLESYNTEVADLNKKYNKIQRILDGQDERYKKLTDEQREQALKAQDDIAKAIENKQKEAQQSLSLLTYQKQEQDANTQLEALNLQIEAVKKGSEEELRLRLRVLKVEEQIALARNKQLPASQQQDESAISAGFKKQRTGLITEFNINDFDQQQALEEAKFNTVKRSEAEITKFKLKQERDRWEMLKQLAVAGSLDWSQPQIDAAEAMVDEIDRKLGELNNFIRNVGEKGLGGTLLENLGFKDEQIDALKEATDIIVDQFQAILDAEVELAEREKELADERVERAQNALDAEIEARNNGYANNVDTARKELELEKKKQMEKQKQLAAAQRRQEALDTLTQTSSLITASANIWKSFSGLGPWGVAAAVAAIALMFGSFAAAKIKAKQVTAKQSEEYGEGGLEFLEGGSHASGNDIDLGVDNKKKRRMHAEGGEALAIINKKNTRRYRRILPGVIDSLNKGIFEDKYLSSFAAGSNLLLSADTGKVDLAGVESLLSAIKAQGDSKIVARADGAIIEVINGKTTRIIKS